MIEVLEKPLSPVAYKGVEQGLWRRANAYRGAADPVLRDCVVDAEDAIYKWRSPNTENTVLDHSMGSRATHSQGTGPLFDFHQGMLGSDPAPHGTRTHPLNMCKLAVTNDVLPVAVAARRDPACERDMSCVDAHGLDSCRDWIAIDHQPHSARLMVTSQVARRWENVTKGNERIQQLRELAAQSEPSADVLGTQQTTRKTYRDAKRWENVTKACDANLSCITGKERIQQLKESDAQREHLADVPGTLLTARRAYRERFINGGEQHGAEASAASGGTRRTQLAASHQLHIKVAAGMDPNDQDEDNDVFSKAVQRHRLALRGLDQFAGTASITESPKAALPESSDARAANRQTCRQLRKEREGRSRRNEWPLNRDMPDIASMTSYLNELASAVDDEKKNMTQQISVDRAMLFAKFSRHLQNCAYVLRPPDALRAATVIAQSADILEARKGNDSTAKSEAQRCTVGVPAANVKKEKGDVASTIASALSSVRSAMDQVLAAIAGRITTAEAPYLVEAMVAMADTRSGRQEYLDAMISHMGWLLAAKPRSFTPNVIARAFWALGRMKCDGGVEDGDLSALATDGDRRAIAALQARLVEVIDDFLEEDVGALALDPSGCAILGDSQLRRVLHRAGRLQVGLKPESSNFLGAMQRLEANTRNRLFQPYQVEVMPFMHHYCQSLRRASGDEPLAGP